MVIPDNPGFFFGGRQCCSTTAFSSPVWQLYLSVPFWFLQFLVARPVPAVGGFVLFFVLSCLLPLCRKFQRRFRDLFFFFVFEKRTCYCIIPRSKRKKGRNFGWYINYARAVHFKNGLILRASWFRFRFRFRLVRWVDGFGGAPVRGVKGGKRLVGR